MKNMNIEEVRKLNEETELVCKLASVGCRGCYFAQCEKGGERNFQCDKATKDILGRCTKEDRKDGQSVIFEEVKKVIDDGNMKVGEIKEINGKRIKCEKTGFMCNGCMFDLENQECKSFGELGECDAKKRSNGDDVIFVLEEE